MSSPQPGISGNSESISTGSVATAEQAREAAATLAAGFRWLIFPPAQETQYRARHSALALDVIQRMLPWVTLLYVAAAVVMFGGSSRDAFVIWLQNALLPVALGLAWFWITRVTSLLGRRVHLHTGIVLAIALVATTRTIFLLGEQKGVIYVTYQQIYLLFIVFTVAQLRLHTAVVVTSLACALIVFDALAEGLKADWLAFGQYYLATALIAGVIGYMMEQRERSEWLKTRILDAEKEELSALKELADRESRRQKIVGDYLALVAGNLTPTEVAGRTLRFLVDKTGAQVGAAYLVHGKRVQRCASYGLDGEARQLQEVERGETLVGQTALDGRQLRLTHLPDDYHPIRTATGSSSPAELLVQPVMHQQESLAVLELGVLTPFNDDTLALVERIVAATASTLVAANAREALARAGMADFII